MQISIQELMSSQKLYEGQVLLNFPMVDREERIVKISTALCVELGELANEKEEFFKFFKIKLRNSKKKQLKEAADCLALYLSLANNLDMELRDPNIEIVKNNSKDSNKLFKDALRELTYIDSGQHEGFRRICVLKSFGKYLSFIYSLDMDFEEIKAYYKDVVLKDNTDRQINKY